MLLKLDRHTGKPLSEDKFQSRLQRSRNFDIVFSFKTREVSLLSKFWLI